MLINLRNAMVGGGKLPYLCELEYIESTGTQYVKLPVRPSSDCDISVDFQVVTFGQGAPFGGGDGNLSKEILVLPLTTTATSTDWTYRCGNKQNLAGLSVSYYDRHTIRWLFNSAYLDGALVSNITAANAFTATRDYMGLFCSLRNGDTSPLFMFKGRIFSCKIYVGGVLVRDLIPVLDYNFTPCMYDRVTRTFFRNAGTGEFVAGPRKGWVNPYVTNGLIAMWDGEWNFAGGVHRGDATMWKDLVGGYNVDLSLVSNIEWSADSLVHTANGNRMFENLFPSFVDGSEFAVEVVCATLGSNTGLAYDNAIVAFNGTGIRIPYIITSGTASIFLANIRNVSTGLSIPFGRHSFATMRKVTDSQGAYSAYVDATRNYNAGSTRTMSLNGTMNLMGLNHHWEDANGNYLKPEICAIRVYSRVFTADEIAANYAVDKARFNLP